MIGYYFKIAVRNLFKRSLYSILNISGLAIGIASFIIISLYIVDELSYDRYHSKSSRIYRIGQISDFGGVGENSASLPFPAGFTLMNDNPDLIESVTRVFNFQTPRTFIEYDDKKFIEKGFFFADSSFFTVFDYNFIKGNAENALYEDFSVVITESIAEKYFGDKDPMGEIIKFEENFPLKITGIIEDVPTQSHFSFDFIGSMRSVKQIYGGNLPRTWVWNPCWTYIVLAENVKPEQLVGRFDDFIQKYFFDAEKDAITLHLQPLTDIHLKSSLDYEIEPNNNIAYIYILSAIAIFILIIACINFMNLATATSTARAREIGMKKVVGAYRTQLVSQFIGESLIITFISAIIALIIVEISIPVFNNFTDKEISLNLLLNPTYLISLIALLIIIGFISGIYPAFYLSAFKPIFVLKGYTKLSSGSGLARKILVVAQFAISIALIIGTLIIFKQINYLKTAQLGFNKENIIVVPVDRTPIVAQYKTFKNELLQNSQIISVTAMDYIFGTAYNTHEFRPEGFPENKWQFYPALVIKHDFVKTFGLKIIAGRDYSEKNKTDPVKGMLINKAMVEHLGWDDPENAIGKRFRSLEGEEKVIGVIDDFNATSLHKPGGPFVLNIKEAPGSIAWFLNFAAIRVKPGDHKETIKFIENKWNEFVKNRPFKYSFLDSELNILYKNEKNLSTLSLIFTILIIFIAILGLFGLASYMAEKRTKEVGIRKVLGANSFNIIKVLSSEYIKLLLIANVVAWPVAYFIITYWLDHFAYRTAISWYIFILSGFFAMVLALSITSIKAYWASRRDPVDTLKYE